MLEAYFTEDNVEVEGVKDNGVSLSFICSCPDWTENKTLTLSDLAIAKAIGMSDPKDYSREDFMREITESFPVKFGKYFIKEWQFPIPAEWREMAKSHIENSMANRMFFAIDAGYIKSMDPPLFGFCLLLEVVETYLNRLPAKDAFLPSDLQELTNNPGLLFEEPITYVED